MKKQQKTIKSEISKRQPLEDHLNFFIQKLFSELKDQEPYYNIKTLAKSTIELPNKSNFKGSNKKKKWFCLHNNLHIYNYLFIWVV